MLETSSFSEAIVIGQDYVRVSTVQKKLGTVRLTDVNCRASAEENQVVENSR